MCGSRLRSVSTYAFAGFIVTGAGIGLLLALVGASSRVVAFAPGLLLIGLGLGVMLTPSVNLVQSSFPEQRQGEISGLSRSVSNLGSSFGTAIAGTILVSNLASGNTTYVIAMVVLAVLALIGLAAATRLGRRRYRCRTPRVNVCGAAQPTADHFGVARATIARRQRHARDRPSPRGVGRHQPSAVSPGEDVGR